MASESIIEQLTDLSRELGREERHLAILGEGNTSADLGDGTFLVKASGSQLASIGPEQFCRIDAQAAITALSADLSEQGVEQALSAATRGENRLRPSIETLMHAVCITQGSARFVGHTHAEACNAILCSVQGARPFLRHIFPDAIVVCGRKPAVVPYVEPGGPLGRAVGHAIEQHRAEFARPPRLILLENHGIVALGQSAREVLNITLMAEKWARILLGTFALGGPGALREQSVNQIDSRLDEEYRRRMLTRQGG